MAKSVWLRKQDLVAFEHGRQAASGGLPRVPARSFETYNEKAAFNDGWDTVSQPKMRAAKSRKPNLPPLEWPAP